MEKKVSVEASKAQDGPVVYLDARMVVTAPDVSMATTAPPLATATAAGAAWEGAGEVARMTAIQQTPT